MFSGSDWLSHSGDVRLARVASGSVLEPLAGFPSVQPELGELARLGGWQEGVGKYPLRIFKNILKITDLRAGTAAVCAGHAPLMI